MKAKHSIPGYSYIRFWALGSLLMVAGAQCRAQTLLASYSMNEGTGTTLQDSSPSDVDLTMSGTALKWSSDGQGLGGSGYALWASMTASTFGAKATNSSTGSTFDGLTSYTITGWINVNASQNGGQLLSIDMADGKLQFVLQDTQLIVNRLVNGVQNKQESSAVTSFVNAGWVFYAITVDSTAASFGDGVKFYLGSELTSAAQVANGTTTASSIANMALGDASTITIANSSGGGSALVNTYLNDFSFYGSTSGASGALSAGAIESIRAASIPEESTTAMLMGFVALMGVLQWKRKHKK
jgi:hypothetical protein